MNLTEHDFLLRPVQCTPGTDASFQRASDPGRQLGMTALQLLKDRDRPQAGRGREHGDDLGIEDIGQRIGPTARTRDCFLRRQSWIVLDAVGRCAAQRRPCCRLRHRMRQSGFHIYPELVIVDVSAGHAVGSLW